MTVKYFIYEEFNLKVEIVNNKPILYDMLTNEQIIGYSRASSKFADIKSKEELFNILSRRWDVAEAEFNDLTFYGFCQSRMKESQNNVKELALDYTPSKYESVIDNIKYKGIKIEKLCDKPLSVIYSRRSGEKQSKYTYKDVKHDIINNYGNSVIIVYAESSSSFKDMAFFHALEIARKEGLELEVYGNNRTELETVTRSVDNMKYYIDYVERHLMTEIFVNGFNLFYDSALILFLTQINEAQWLNKANTKIAKKHAQFKKALRTQDMSILNDEEYKELIALIKYNRSIERTIKFIQKLERRAIANKKAKKAKKATNKKAKKAKKG